MTSPTSTTSPPYIVKPPLGHVLLTIFFALYPIQTKPFSNDAHTYTIDMLGNKQDERTQSFPARKQYTFDEKEIGINKLDELHTHHILPSTYNPFTHCF
jgi:hypothetical protein